MLTRFCVFLLCCGVLAACNRSDDSGSKSAADWAKVGKTDGCVYYAGHASMKKADEVVTMADLFDYKTARTEGGGGPRRGQSLRDQSSCGRHSLPSRRPERRQPGRLSLGSGRNETAPGARTRAPGRLTRMFPDRRTHGPDPTQTARR